MKKIYKYISLSLLVPMAFSCTDLEIEPTDSLITEGFAGVANVEGEVANIRNIISTNQLANQGGLFALNEVSSDEYVVPTRGTDWGDNGAWLSIHRQSWNAELGDIINTWQQLNSVTINATRTISEKV